MTLIIIAAMMILNQPAIAEDIKITRVKDGDTVEIILPGLPKEIGNTIPLRIQGIDTPELRGKCAEEIERARQAKLFLFNAINQAMTTEVRIKKRDKYFRLVGDISIDGQLASELLIKNGLARPYDGKRRSIWCTIQEVKR